MSVLAPELTILRSTPPAAAMRVRGRVSALRGLTLLVDELPVPTGALVRVMASGAEPRVGEVVGFDSGRAVVMLLGQTTGVRSGDFVYSEQSAPIVRVGRRLLGRVIDGLGRPIDEGPELEETMATPLSPPPLSPMRRRRISQPIATGVRVLDAMLTVGRGQRIGVFAGPGVGKSTLLGSIARHTSADVNVIALIGERGREVRDFIEKSLGEHGLRRSVVVAATSDESPLLRVRAMSVACAVAEFFRARGADVMLMMDSITRFAQAQRQVGLTVGEPPATKGYTPSVFAALPLLLERAGAVEGEGSITGFYTVLVEGDDMTEPIADAARGVLDGHIILSRELARRGHYPAIDVLDSISRVADEVCDGQHIAARRQLVRLLAAHREVEELVQIGAYARGSNPTADVALAMREKIEAFLRQGSEEFEQYDDARNKLMALALESGSLQQPKGGGRGA